MAANMWVSPGGPHNFSQQSGRRTSYAKQYFLAGPFLGHSIVPHIAAGWELHHDAGRLLPVKLGKLLLVPGLPLLLNRVRPALRTLEVQNSFVRANYDVLSVMVHLCHEKAMHELHFSITKCHYLPDGPAALPDEVLSALSASMNTSCKYAPDHMADCAHPRPAS